MSRRRIALVLIALLALGDLVAAAYLSVLWTERHAPQATAAAQATPRPTVPSSH